MSNAADEDPGQDGADAAPATPRRERTGGNSFPGDFVVNLRRWSLKARRNPFLLVGTVVQPVVFFVLFTQIFGGVATEAIGSAAAGAGGGGAAAATGGASGGNGAPISYETYLVPAIAMQVALVAAASSGIGLVNDIENGMFEKTLVSPMSRTAVFLGKSAAEVVLILVQIGLILALGLLFGARIETGVPGAVGIALIGILFSVWFTAYSNVVAVITRDQESTIIAANLLVFPLLFLSSAFLPLDALPGWIQTLAAFNPVTYGVDAARALVLGADVTQVVEVTAFGGMWNTILPAVAILLVIDVVFGAVAVYMLHRASSAAVQ